MAPLTSASQPPITTKMAGASHISFQLRHCMMHAHSAMMRCMPPTRRSVQYTVKRTMSPGS